MNPIDWNHRKPEDHECMILRHGHHVMRYCWFGSAISHTGIIRWHWKWCSVPETTDWRNTWPLTHWLPADVEVLPATYGNNGTDSPNNPTMQP